MSVIVRTPSGKIKLFCKGADTVIYERLASSSPLGAQHQAHIRQVTTAHLEQFAREGLRTLCCAVAEIPHDVYDEWRHTYHKASTSMQVRLLFILIFECFNLKFNKCSRRAKTNFQTLPI